MRTYQIVGELCLCAFPVCAVVLKDEVHHPWAVGLGVTVSVPRRWVYLGSRLLCLVGGVVDSLPHYGVGCPL